MIGENVIMILLSKISIRHAKQRMESNRRSNKNKKKADKTDACAE